MDHDRTVPRALVHKAGPEAVWITDLEKVDADHYHCVGQVPRAHSYINDAVPPLHTYYDLGLLSELGRQAGIATMHEFEGVDVKAPTVFMKFDLAVVDPVVPNDRTPAPVTAEMDITYLNREFADGVLSTVFAETTFTIDGVLRATSTSLAAAHERQGYKAWRQEMKAARPPMPIPEVVPIDPARVGRRLVENVLIGELTTTGADFTCPVLVDQLHPHFFEHPMDHIPGVVHLEAMRQAALVAAAERFGCSPDGAVVAEVRTRFTGFAELHLPTSCAGRLGEPVPRDDGGLDVPVRLTLGQPGDDTTTSARMTMRLRPRG